MEFLLAAIAVLMGSGAIAWGLQRWPVVSTRFAAIGHGIATALGMVPVWKVLGGYTGALSISLPWEVPFGSGSLGLDPLSAWFLIPILIVPALASIFACDSLLDASTRLEQAPAATEHAANSVRRIGSTVFLLNFLSATMLTVILARNGVLFLVAWELISFIICGLILSTRAVQEKSLDDSIPDMDQQTAWWTFGCWQVGNACLWGLFTILFHSASNSMNFEASIPTLPLNSGHQNAIYVLALFGFGPILGLIPFHSGLITALNQTPAHIRVILSACCSVLGLYGFFRLISLSGLPPNWWNWLLIVIGLGTGMIGVWRSRSQRDLTSFLACAGLQSQGLLVVGLGLGLLAWQGRPPAAQITEMIGSLFHAWSHAAILGLLHFAAGIIELRSGSGRLPALGGQMKRLPWTSGAFLFGAVAFCGIPPLSGFTSQYLLFWSLSDSGEPQGVFAPAVLVVPGLIFLNALTLVSFVKVCSQTLLGASRTVESASPPVAVGWRLRLPMLLLAIGCFSLGLLAPQLAERTLPVAHSCSTWIGIQDTGNNLSNGEMGQALALPIASLSAVRVATSVFSLVLIGLIVARTMLLRRAEVTIAALPSQVGLVVVANLPSYRNLPFEKSPRSNLWNTVTNRILPLLEQPFSALEWANRLPVNWTIMSLIMTLLALFAWQWGGSQ